MAPTRDSRLLNTRALRGRKVARPPPRKEFAIPYFAHQELDQDRYGHAPGLSLPVGEPGWVPAPAEITTATNCGWDEDNETFLASNSEDDTISFETATVDGKRSNATSCNKQNPYKRLRVTGGRPAVAKKVTADLDSDDELIVRMKNAKYLERDIAKRLADEGRTSYNPKTIGTRWARIRKALAIRNDELLDAEMTDWHEGDNDALYQAYQQAHEIIERAKADADSRMWRVVADQLKAIKPVTNFSQNACRSRYEALQTGTAKPTPESIALPDEHILERIQARQEKEARIRDDAAQKQSFTSQANNLDGNAWTSKSRRWA